MHPEQNNYHTCLPSKKRSFLRDCVHSAQMGILAPLSTEDTTTRAASALGAAPHSRHLKLPGEPTYAHFLETHGPVASGRWVVGTEGTSPKPQGNPGHIPTAQLCSPPGAAGTGSPPPPTRARAPKHTRTLTWAVAGARLSGGRAGRAGRLPTKHRPPGSPREDFRTSSRSTSQLPLFSPNIPSASNVSAH